MKFTFQPESRPLDGYTLKRGIARGGFGEVYYALSDAGKEVAVKLLQHNLDVELRGVQQCLNLRHANLVTIFDVRTDADDDHWVVMEYIPGQTLEQILQSNAGPLPLDQIERWLHGLAGGLSYLHDRGIVHRDVKPGNVFWDQGNVKLGDVGLSKFMSPSRRSAHTESVGTVYYMAPEVSYGKYGYEVDIYSVGVMLYEMLTGKLPFDGQSTGEILMKHLSEPPDLSIVPARYRAMLAAALAKDPKQRTSSMAKLVEDFRLAQRDTSKLAEPLVMPKPPVAPRPVRREDDSVWVTPAARPIPVSRAVSPPAAPVAAAVVADVPEFGWWVPRVLMCGIAYAIVRSLFFRFDWGDGPFPLNLLMAWPLLLVCLRMQPTRGSGLQWLWQGDHAWLTGGLIRHLEQNWGAGKLIQTLREWDQTAPGYWTLRSLLFIGMQTLIAGLSIILAHDPSQSIAAILKTSPLMFVIYLLSLIPNRPEKAAGAGQIRQSAVAGRTGPGVAGVHNRDLPAPEAPPNRSPGAVQRPAAVQRPGYRPAPPPLPAGMQTNLRFADLARSLNWATVLTLLFGSGVGFLSPLFGTQGSLQPDLGKIGLFTLTTLIGVWSVLIMSKLTVNLKENSHKRRLAGLVTGAIVGSAAWWLSKVLLVDLPIDGASHQAVFDSLGRQPLSVNSEPTWLAFCIFFGLLFGVRRWWWHADPLRPALFRISSVILTVAVGLILPKLFLFPFDWAVTWSAVMSCVVQLSASWIPPESRTRRG